METRRQAGPGSVAVEDVAALAGEAVSALAAKGRSVATAESLTGGLLAGAITDVPGASKVLRGGAVTYATDVKASLLGIDLEVLAIEGPVSQTVAAEMSRGARRLLAADYGVATTGVAGPDAQDGHPPGTVFVAVCGPDGAVEVRRLCLGGDREEVRRQSVAAALRLLLQLLGESRPE